MAQPQITDVLSSLAMPLRDIARTLRAASHASEPIAKPAADLLPPPLHHFVEGAMRRADEIGARILDPELPDAGEIANARQGLTVDPTPLERQAALVRMLHFGMVEALNRLDHKDYALSESRLALVTARTLAPHHGTVNVFPLLGRLMSGLTDAHLLLTFSPHAAEPERARLIAAASAVLWVAVDRDADSDELKLLALCIDVARHTADDFVAAAGDAAALGALIERLAAIV